MEEDIVEEHIIRVETLKNGNMKVYVDGKIEPTIEKKRNTNCRHMFSKRKKNKQL